MPLKLMECGPKCRSKRHAYEVNAAISKGTLREIQQYSSLCYNGTQIADIHGRSALHVAAACGKTDMVEWLLDEKQGDITQKDRESGWTALHRAMFYGWLTTARLLIQAKSDLNVWDHEGLGPLDLAMKDRALIKSVTPAVYEPTDRHEVFTWGDNSNFTLGHMTEQRRPIPEVVDEFRKQGSSIRQIVMCKYHTVFLTTDGHVYTCGHGQGGRLGHPTEETCLVPRLVEGVCDEQCIEVAAGRDHTLLLYQSGQVYSCGMNESHQLGQIPVVDKCLTPKLATSKAVKGKAIVGICAGRFHSVLYTSNALFTCGLNAGQLGHPKQTGDRRISQLRQVTALHVRSLAVVMVRCSDAVTVVLTEVGEIHVLHEYQCRIIASNRPDIARLYVVGGNLDHTDSHVLRENHGRELVISYLNQSGKVFVWREKSPSLKRAVWLISRSLYVIDFILTESGLGMVTDCGEVFVCTLSTKPPPVRENMHSNKESTEGEFGRTSLLELLMQEETEEVQVRRIPNIHRAMYITADRKGHNYATLQSAPNCNLTDVPCVSHSEMKDNFTTLLRESDEFDLVHDLILQVHEERWPVHKYVLLSRCTNFHSFLSKCSPLPASDTEEETPIIDIPNVRPQILQQLLTYIYTDTCDLVTPGSRFVLSDHPHQSTEEIFPMDLDRHEHVVVDARKVSAFQVHQQNKKKRSKEEKNKNSRSSQEQNPVNMLHAAARHWGLKSLTKRLECVKYKNEMVQSIQSTGGQQVRSSLAFDRKKMRDSKWDLCDISICSEDGTLFPCHKCILVARLEYFHSMLASGWMETSASTALSLPVPGDILEILLDFLYTDEAPAVYSCQNVEMLCNILVVADQMLVTRLKEMCEVTIAALITLKNVGELLEIASVYNASQLRTTCQQYIVINLAALMEGRNLDVVSDGVMDELSQYYRLSIDNMARRIITPYSEGPEKDFLEALVAEEDGSCPSATPAIETKKSKSRKRRSRTKSGTEDVDKGVMLDKGPRYGSERLLSVSSDISVHSDEDIMEVDETGDHVEAKETPVPLPIPAQFPVVRPARQRNSQKLPPQGSSVASPTGSPSPWGQSGPCPSPQSPGADGPSLRQIMQQEGSRREDINTNARSQKSGRFSWKDVKKQQTHQKGKVKPAAQSKEVKHNQSAEEESPVPSSPWGSMNKVVQSFRSLMVEQTSHAGGSTSSQGTGKGQGNTSSQGTSKGQGSTSSQGTGKKQGSPSVQGTSKGQGTMSAHQAGKQGSIKGQGTTKPQAAGSSVISWGLPQNRKATPRLHINSKPGWDVGPVSPRSPENPWVTAGLAQSPTEAACSFSDILQDEKQRTDVLIKTSNKPLALIQIEEQAIQDLLKHYGADTNVDERITVERVVQAAAAPLWKRERVQST